VNPVRRSSTSMARRLLVVWFLFYSVCALGPFGETQHDPQHAQRPFQYGPYQRDPVDFFLNMLLFVPLGVLLQHEGRRRGVRMRSTLLVTFAASAITSGSIEYLQVFLPRDSSLFDVLANIAGALVGLGAEPGSKFVKAQVRRFSQSRNRAGVHEHS
jgi:VanZ family protein